MESRLGRRLKLCLVTISFWELIAVSFEKRLRLVWAACGFGWIRLKCSFFIFKQVFKRVYLLGECDAVNNEVMDLICKSLWILGADLRKRLACLCCAAEKEKRGEGETL